MSVGFSALVRTATWSPCSRFIAISWGVYKRARAIKEGGGNEEERAIQKRGAIEILDAVTLGQLNAFPQDTMCQIQYLIFSPDAHLLTLIGGNPDRITTWDVQTGILVSVISPEPQGYHKLVITATHSPCGRIIGLCTHGTRTPTISTYNILSGKHIYSHRVEGQKLAEVWTHGECLRFAVLKSGIITTWEVGFASIHTLTEVASLPLPDDFATGQLLYNPPLSRLVYNDRLCPIRVHVWDAQHSKCLLKQVRCNNTRHCFSTNGQFFVGRVGSDVFLWKESPMGYVLHQKLIFTTADSPMAYISPNGKLVLTLSGSVVQSWRITDSNIPSPTISTQPQDNKPPLLVFSPDEALAAVTQLEGITVIVLDLKFGVPRLVIDTGMEVYGLGMGRGAVVVIGYDPGSGDRKIVTWNIPARDYVLNSKAGSDHSVKTTIFHDPPEQTSPPIPPASVSPDLNHFVMLEINEGVNCNVHLYDVLTGQHLASASGCSPQFGRSPWFSRDGSRFWCMDGIQHDMGWEITKDSKSNITRLEHLEENKCPPDEFPWQCPPRYEVTDGWVLHSSGKRLLWLPPHWWSGQFDRVRSGQFLALLNSKLPEVLILELE